ncbi:xylose operon transcription regulator XylR [Rubritalea marina]|uniref:AraC family transcriptional regulator n=1 Tax=Rubritalea marina TaxID=361055 RepID=UPI0003702FFF|nr:DNA-binding transcriptional regulator [Rubritalea marina]
MMGKPDVPRVALIVETSLSVGQGILMGISDYVKKYGPWSVYAFPHALDQAPRQWFKHWKGDGIIARLQNEEIREAVMDKGVPVVDVLGVCRPPEAALVHVDDNAISVMVAEHFIEQRFREFAYIGLEKENWSVNRERSFRTRVEEARGGYRSLLLSRETFEQTAWDELVELVANWIAKLPVFTGIMLSSDAEGLLVQEACRRAERIVGQDIGLVGVGNDPTLCNLNNPPLSSVDVDIESVGYQAASLLDSMMAGKQGPNEPLWIMPRRVIARKSSDFVASPDEDLARALQYISSHYAESLSLDTIARHSGLSRSSLQRKFRQILNRTVFEEVTLARVRAAMELLQTDISIDEIAELTGFGYAQSMGRVFRKKLGHSPKHYRRWDR